MNEVTKQWLKMWKRIWFYAFLVIAGIPTFGLLWVYFDYQLDSWREHEKENWKLIMVQALEPWVHFWRGVLLFFAGFVTLGYTWILMAHLEEPFYMGLRKKYADKK